jgi:uncharacterized membrane protein YbhN (UPF0104 family)
MVSEPIAPRSSRRTLATRAVAIVVVCAGLGYAVREMDWEAVGQAIAAARLWPIALAAVINFGIILAKAGAWRLLLAPEHTVPLVRLFRYTLVSCAGSVILPLRAGEIVRVWLLRERDGVPTSRTAAVAIAEKLLDVLSMAVVMLPLLWLGLDLPASFRWWICGLVVLALGGLLVLRIASRRSKSPRWFGQVIAALDVLGRPRRVLGALALLVASWLIDLAMIHLVLHAVGVDLSFPAGLVVLFAVNVAIAVPSTPAQLGALELGALAGLRLLHAPEAPALAFAVLYHALQVLPILIVSLITDFRLVTHAGEATTRPG